MTASKHLMFAAAGLLAGSLASPLMAQSPGVSEHKMQGGEPIQPVGPGKSRLPLVDPKIVLPGESTGGALPGNPGSNPAYPLNNDAETKPGAAPGAAPGK